VRPVESNHRLDRQRSRAVPNESSARLYVPRRRVQTHRAEWHEER
jgi:hypothetical protein